MLNDEQKAILPVRASIQGEAAGFVINGGIAGDIDIAREILYLTTELATALLRSQRDRLALTAIVEQLEKCEYECEAGPLSLNIAFIELVEMAQGAK